MALKSFQKTHAIMESITRLEQLKQDVKHHHQQEWQRNKRKRARQQQDEEWSLLAAPNTRTSTDSSNNRESDNIVLKLTGELQALVHIFTEGIQEILSRIHHASRALFLEVSRGFFLPFCTVMLSALARIRAMLLYIGRTALTQIQNTIQPDLLELLGSGVKAPTREWLRTSEFEMYMSEFLDSEKDGNALPAAERDPLIAFDRDSLLTSLGLSLPKTLIARDSKPDKQTTKLVVNVVSTHSDDIGVSVESSKRPAPTAERAASNTPDRSNIAASTHHDHHAIERNMKFVESYKRKQHAPVDAAVPKKAKVATTSTSKSAKGENDKNAAKKEKKKKNAKKSKGNFFDNLFDS